MTEAEHTRFLRVYMADQLALGVLWREIARRCKRSNEGSPVGDAVARVADEIAEDVVTFEQIMIRLGIPKARVKPALAIAGERLGRLKLNGRLTEYSPLSRFEELDVLRMGIDGKMVLWANLRDLAGLAGRLPDVDFDGLIERARRQRDTIEPFRQQAGREAFGATAAVPGVGIRS